MSPIVNVTTTTTTAVCHFFSFSFSVSLSLFLYVSPKMVKKKGTTIFFSNLFHPTYTFDRTVEKKNKNIYRNQMSYKTKRCQRRRGRRLSSRFQRHPRRYGGERLGQGSYGSYYAKPCLPCLDIGGETWQQMLEENDSFGVKVFLNSAHAFNEIEKATNLRTRFRELQRKRHSNEFARDLFQKNADHYFSLPLPWTGDDGTTTIWVCVQDKSNLISSYEGNPKDIPFHDNANVQQLYYLKYNNAEGDFASLHVDDIDLQKSRDGSSSSSPAAIHTFSELLDSWSTQLVNCVLAMHYCEIAHHDLKPANILRYHGGTRLRVNDFDHTKPLGEVSAGYSMTFDVPFFYVYPTHAHYLAVLRNLLNSSLPRNAAMTPTQQAMHAFVRNAFGNTKDAGKNPDHIKYRTRMLQPFFDFYSRQTDETRRTRLEPMYQQLKRESLQDGNPMNTFLETSAEINRVLRHRRVPVEQPMSKDDLRFLCKYIDQRIDMFSIGISLMLLCEKVFSFETASSEAVTDEDRFRFYLDQVSPFIVSPTEKTIQDYVQTASSATAPDAPQQGFVPLLQFLRFQPLPSHLTGPAVLFSSHVPGTTTTSPSSPTSPIKTPHVTSTSSGNNTPVLLSSTAILSPEKGTNATKLSSNHSGATHFYPSPLVSPESRTRTLSVQSTGTGTSTSTPTKSLSRSPTQSSSWLGLKRNLLSRERELPTPQVWSPPSKRAYDSAAESGEDAFVVASSSRPPQPLARSGSFFERVMAESAAMAPQLRPNQETQVFPPIPPSATNTSRGGRRHPAGRRHHHHTTPRKRKTRGGSSRANATGSVE